MAISSTAKKDANKAGRDVNDKINDEDAAPAEKPTLSRGLLAIVTLAAFVAAFSLAAPFLGGVQNIIGLAIIAFALFQAWKMNRARILPITGPYQLGSRNAGAIA